MKSYRKGKLLNLLSGPANSQRPHKLSILSRRGGRSGRTSEERGKAHYGNIFEKARIAKGLSPFRSRKIVGIRKERGSIQRKKRFGTSLP